MAPEDRERTGSIEEARQDLEIAAKDAGETQYEEGFTAKAIVGAFFVGFVMLPGAMYLGLVAGQGLGTAAQWVTIILFSEIARRSFMPLKRQEIYILYYIAGGIASGAAHGLAGGPFADFIWNQYLVQAPQAAHVAKEIPHWAVPQGDSPAIIGRTFLHAHWVIPIALMLTYQVLGRFYWVCGGYALFRLTSDVERLPFPMAPIAAAGATALAEAGTKEDSWRWQVFSVGAMLGMVYGFFYLFIPIFTGSILSKPLYVIPILFVDFTQNTERVLPAALAAFSTEIGHVLIGFVLPFPIVIGSVITSVICQIGVNPILYHKGMLPDYRLGMGIIPTQIATNIDFWMSVGIGTGVAIGIIGLVSVGFTLKRARQMRDRPTMRRTLPPGRGDWSIKISLVIWFVVTLLYVTICHMLVPEFPLWILVLFGLIYSPLISYVSARMVGLSGHGVGFPMLREAAIIKSGYRSADIWMAPLPMHDLGGTAQRFREVELTGTKFTSVIKAELLMFPIILSASFIFWSFIWKTNPIPSPQFAYTQKMWPQTVTMQALWMTANKEVGEANWLFKALKFNVMGYAGVGTFILYGVVAAAKLPLLFFYGLVDGMLSPPMMTIPRFMGALLGRYYFARRFGAVKWTNYAPVLLAGFGCGTGLISMSGIALALIAKSVNYLPF